MRVAVYHNLPPGGALRVLHELVRRSCTEHEYDLYTVDLGPFDHFAYARDHAEQHDLTRWVAHSYRYPVMAASLASRLPAAGWSATGGRWLDRVQRRMAADIDARGYDVALVHPCRVTHTPAILRHLRTPALHYMHEHRRRTFEAGYQAADPTLARYRRVAARAVERDLRRADRAAARAATRIACSSHYTAECIRRSYGREARVCYPGIDTSAFDLGLSDAGDRPTVLSVGALDPSKGHDVIVRALSLLPAAARPALDLVYERVDPTYRARIEALATSSGVELSLRTGIADAELARRYRAAIATVVAGQLEPLGLVPLESMACGTPVVAVREAGYRETVDDGVNGYLVDRSAVEIAAALAQIMAGGLGRTSAEIRHTVVSRWSWDGVLKCHHELLAATAEGGVG